MTPAAHGRLASLGDLPGSENTRGDVCVKRTVVALMLALMALTAVAGVAGAGPNPPIIEHSGR